MVMVCCTMRMRMMKHSLMDIHQSVFHHSNAHGTANHNHWLCIRYATFMTYMRPSWSRSLKTSFMAATAPVLPSSTCLSFSWMSLFGRNIFDEAIDDRLTGIDDRLTGTSSHAACFRA